MMAQEKAWRWGVPVIWATILTVSCFTQASVSESSWGGNYGRLRV